ncbi:MAG: 3-hydroxyisobutyryl-CoA hydrolase [Galactobacter sp.]
MTEPSGAEDPVLFEVRGGLGLIILNRPRAVNALTHQMVNLIWSRLVAWAKDDTVERVAITGAGERGLCSGGDIVAIHEDMTRPDRTASTPYATLDFWRDEYRLNLLISRYPKPYIALMDGLVLGGGIGLSAHGSHRVVTERTRSGLPETQIGFSPDVGGTYLLGHAPGATGAHAALTGAHLDSGDAIHLGLADVFVPSESLSKVLEGLESEGPHIVLPRYAGAAPDSGLAARRAMLDDAYGLASGGRLADGDGRPATAVAQSLEAAGLTEEAEVIRSKSPTSVTVALAAVRAGAEGDLQQALQNEWRVGARLLAGHDFPEGIRAQVIDKDRHPRWEPATLEEVAPGTDHDHLAPLPNLPLDVSPVNAALS